MIPWGSIIAGIPLIKWAYFKWREILLTSEISVIEINSKRILNRVYGESEFDYKIFPSRNIKKIMWIKNKGFIPVTEEELIIGQLSETSKENTIKTSVGAHTRNLHRKTDKENYKKFRRGVMYNVVDELRKEEVIEEEVAIIFEDNFTDEDDIYYRSIKEWKESVSISTFVNNLPEPKKSSKIKNENFLRLNKELLKKPLENELKKISGRAGKNKEINELIQRIKKQSETDYLKAFRYLIIESDRIIKFNKIKSPDPISILTDDIREDLHDMKLSDKGRLPTTYHKRKEPRIYQIGEDTIKKINNYKKKFLEGKLSELRQSIKSVRKWYESIYLVILLGNGYTKKQVELILENCSPRTIQCEIFIFKINGHIITWREKGKNVYFVSLGIGELNEHFNTLNNMRIVVNGTITNIREYKDFYENTLSENGESINVLFYEGLQIGKAVRILGKYICKDSKYSDMKIPYMVADEIEIVEEASQSKPSETMPRESLDSYL